MDSREVNAHRTLATPIWMVGIRIAQVVLSIVVLGMAAAWSSYTLFDAPSLGIATAVLTWVFVAYILVTEKVPAVNIAYTIYAVVILDLLLCILWLATWALAAARRAQLGNINDGVFGGNPGHGQYCYNGICYNYKRSVERRSVSLRTLSGLLTGIAVIGAVIWVLFIATLAWTIYEYFIGRKEGRFTHHTAGAAAAGHVEEQKVPPQQAQQPQPTQFTEPQYGQQQQAYPQNPQQPAEAGHYQAPQVATEHQQPQQQYHDPNQITPQPQQQQ